MCYLFYTLMTGLFLIYSDYLLEQYALAVPAGEGEWTITALGWEILPEVWPAFVMVGILASAVTFFITRGIYSKKS